MKRFIAGTDRGQSTLFPECLEDWIGDDNAVRVIDVFVEELDLGELGFGGVDPEATGRPSYHPSMLLKVYIYGGVYLIGANFSRARARRSRATRSSRLGGASPISFSSNSFSRYSDSGRTMELGRSGRMPMMMVWPPRRRRATGSSPTGGIERPAV